MVKFMLNDEEKLKKKEPVELLQEGHLGRQREGETSCDSHCRPSWNSENGHVEVETKINFSKD